MKEFTTIGGAKRITGLSYVGLVNNSSKHEKAYKYNEMVYTIYLAPANSSGYEVCPGRTKWCTEACLNQSGRNIMDQGREIINGSRIKKTKLFFEDREFFVRWVVAEIKKAEKKAIDEGFRFSVRLNNTSDISPEDFLIEGVNILEMFPDITFYDYTKVFDRMKLLDKYPNYDLTYSFTGNNWDQCKKILDDKTGRVAVVFNEVPDQYLGYTVINGNDYDMRYLDPKGVIVGLPYKKVRKKLDPNNNFVIQN